MSKGQLPKAYLRMDPNLDQTHPDPGGFVRLLCAAARQPQRGRFSSRQLLDGILGKGLTTRLVQRRDVVEIAGGKWYVQGWDEWQEGDLTVGERQRRIRDRRGVKPLHDRDGGVTPPLENRDSPSRQQDSEATDSESLLREIPLPLPEDPGVVALLARGWPKVTEKQRDLLFEIAERHDHRHDHGQWAATIIMATPPNEDPLAAVKTADAKWQRQRRAEIDAEEASWKAEKEAERVHVN